MNERQEGLGEFVVARGDASKLFDAIEHALDTVAILVGFEVARWRIAAICAWRDDRQNGSHQQAGTDVVAIESLVRQHFSGLCDRQSQKRLDAEIVGNLPTGQDKAKRASLTVCAGVDFCRKAAA